jgi:hypothetical protein
MSVGRLLLLVDHAKHAAAAHGIGISIYTKDFLAGALGWIAEAILLAVDYGRKEGGD